ncbi:uncharacterized protein LOC124386266 [Silurus meridionalis]|uniref:uncharacterized protein LOC124386266 n=1 Tax=Silurus meridionalis TaxID=175797 RepID=UPI001EEA1E86|nr:uncharacterized protein LOC124386266 [Silurus meridionalis]
MAALWIVTLSLIMSHAVDSIRPSFISVKPGERVTLNCTIQDLYVKELMIWYKQQFGKMPQEVGNNRENRDAHTSTEINSRFKIDDIKTGISLTIVEVKKSDEGLYFCGLYTWGKFTFSKGTFIAVTGDEDVKVSVLQSSVSDSVPAGASVTLQCSVLSESRAAELQVLWFRAAPSQSHPQLIYTHHNSSLQCESESSTHTCVYNLSKNIFSLNDTGTYYCAVVLCGKIIFGNGTRVQFTEQHFKGSDSLVICLAVALVVCVVVIFAQAILNYKKRSIEQHMVKPPQGAQKHKTHNQEREAVEMSYAALSFTEGKTKSGKIKKDRHKDTIYSDVIYTSHT